MKASLVWWAQLSSGANPAATVQLCVQMTMSTRPTLLKHCPSIIEYSFNLELVFQRRTFLETQCRKIHICVFILSKKIEMLWLSSI